MELAKTGENQVVASEDFEKMEFGISQENIGLILETLRSKMYSNPIAAICREIASNCRDSHREAGKPNEPIEIRISDGDVFMGVAEDVHATINFIDYGIGISPERIKNIYLLFGASTKRSDNSQTGGFGYGAKTPFAYSDSFAVITNYNGKKYTYFFSIGESRRGDAYLISEMDTTDPNGTTVSIPLKDEDRQKFEYELIRATYFWDVLPNFTGRFSMEFKSQIDNRDSTILFKKEKFLMATNSSPRAFRTFAFIIDGIYYDYTNTKELEPFRQLVESTAQNKKVFLVFKTGEVTISTNRESLYYDKKTIALILRNSKEYASTIKKEYIKCIKEYKGVYYNFACAVSDYRRSGSSTSANDLKTKDLHKCLQGFDRKFVESCRRKYFDFYSGKKYSGSNTEHSFLSDIDKYMQIYRFGKFVAGQKRDRRVADNLSSVIGRFMSGEYPLYSHQNFLERDSIKKNLTIFKQWPNARYYAIILTPKLDRGFYAPELRRLKDEVEKINKKISLLDPKSRDFDIEKRRIIGELHYYKAQLREAIHKRKVLARFWSEFPKICSKPIPTYDSIPETKISRKPNSLTKDSYRAVTQTVRVDYSGKNLTRELKISNDAAYSEVKASELQDAIIVQTASNNVYQIQTEIRNSMPYVSYVSKLAFLFSEMFFNRSNNKYYVSIVYAKSTDYALIKSNVARRVYKLEDFIAEAKKCFTEEKMRHIMNQYHMLSHLNNTKPGDYPDLLKFVKTERKIIWPKVLRQLRFEERTEKIRTKVLGGYGNDFRQIIVFDPQYINSTSQREVCGYFTYTKLDKLFASNAGFNDLFKSFKDMHDKLAIRKVKQRKNLKEVFRKHYGVFVTDLIENYYRPANSYNKVEHARVGICKMIREIDKKYEAFYNKK